MPPTHYTGEEIVRRGMQWYEASIRPQVGTADKGKFLVINVETGEYEMDADGVAAGKRAKAKFPDAPLFTMRVGYAAAFRLGSQSRVKSTGSTM